MIFKLLRFSKNMRYERAALNDAYNDGGSAAEEAENADEIGPFIGHIRDTKKISVGVTMMVANSFWFLINLGLVFGMIIHKKDSRGPEVDFVIPPLQNVISYEIHQTDIGIGHVSEYGMDTPEADELWREISQDGPYGWVTVQKEDLDAINQTSVKLADGSGYLAGLEVYHELHCLNWFRRKILGKNFTISEDPTPEYHLPHCLEILRNSIMCHADLSLMPLRWVEGYPIPWPVFQTTRKCRRWDDIFEWTKKHNTGVDKVVHPHMGHLGGKPFDPSKTLDVNHIVYIEEE